MKSLRNLLLVTGMIALSGCTVFDVYSEVDALNEAKAVGSPFTQALAAEYKTFANRELKDMFDYPDALHFARKGLASASGESVMPEPVNDWNLSEEHIKELGAARGRLVVAFDLGGREIAPATAAKAQVNYDCWIEQQEENWQTKDILSCKKGFLDAMNELEGLVQQGPQPVAADEPPPMVPEEAMYLVFFNWDAFDVSTSANSVLEAVAKEVSKNTPAQVNIQGHADTSGASDYNQRLAFKRATAVRDALVKLGVPENLINIESRGEDELLVPTPDNVREPANRRANISFK
ncbi:MAG: OmpA family protein [Alphaproteobacteria bacterium]|nr:OmpA family protein [Alphaproteobacteria bacterium]MBP7758907.1 OmpA family protein [Alphaproteobacteria bacterium]MBP7762181.1 OmpA family protein [Alphaproteobacteria bacterium]MBP7905316.1 OmpA family protein [Alphaproteobacteria bacterium]